MLSNVCILPHLTVTFNVSFNFMCMHNAQQMYYCEGSHVQSNTEKNKYIFCVKNHVFHFSTLCISKSYANNRKIAECKLLFFGKLISKNSFFFQTNYSTVTINNCLSKKKKQNKN